MTTMTKTRRIARFQKLLKTLRETERMVSEFKIADAGATLARTRQNIATVESQLAIWGANDKE